MCVSKSGFYKWFECKDKNHHFEFNLEEEIKKIHTSSRGTYGRRRILSTLKKSFIKVGKKRVSKIMKKLKEIKEIVINQAASNTSNNVVKNEIDLKYKEIKELLESNDLYYYEQTYVQCGRAFSND
jgi:hypothetical protein